MASHLVTVATGSDPQTPFAYEVGTEYEIVAADGTRVTFNDSTDRDFVGYLEEVTGIDSPDVRESFDLIVEGDGARHSNFFHGRRPITLSGLLNPGVQGSVANKNATRLLRVTNAMRQDAYLRWTVTGGVPVQVAVRRGAPPRITGNRTKQFLVTLVAADPRVYSQATKTFNAYYLFGGAGGNVTNSGTVETFPTITIGGTCVNPTITNNTTGKSLSLTTTLTATQSLELNFADRTIKTQTGANAYSTMNYTTSQWFGLVPGVNSLTVTATGTVAYGNANASRVTISHNDAWL